MSSRVTLITGAASGLARGIAVALSRSGYRIAFTYRAGGTSPDETRALIEPNDRGVVAVAADFSTFDSAAHVVREVERLRGPVEVLIHAVGPIVVKPFARSTAADYHAMVDGNLGSSVGLALAVLPGMRERGFGRLVFFGMNGTHVTQPAPSMSLYGAAKAGVVTFARTLALEEARSGITTNVIEPGDIRDKNATRAQAREIAAPNNPTGHAGSWEDIAEAVRFAVADESSFLNGMVLTVNGGLVAAHE